MATVMAGGCGRRCVSTSGAACHYTGTNEMHNIDGILEILKNIFIYSMVFCYYDDMILLFCLWMQGSEYVITLK